MAQLIVRKLPDEVVASLKERASRNGRSVEAEVREILLDAARPSLAPLLAEAAQFRAELAASYRGDSTAIIRAYRDNNFEPLPEDLEDR